MIFSTAQGEIEMKRIASGIAALALVTACGEPASEAGYETIEGEVTEETAGPTEHFEPAAPPSEAEREAVEDSE